MCSNEEISLFSNNICCVLKYVDLFSAIANRLTEKGSCSLKWDFNKSFL